MISLLIEIIKVLRYTSTHNDLLGPRPSLGGNLAIASRATASARSSASASATAAAAAAVKAGSSSCLLALHLNTYINYIIWLYFNDDATTGLNILEITCSCKLPATPLSWKSRRGSRRSVPPSWRRMFCKIRFWSVRGRLESALRLAGTSSDLSSSFLSRCCRHSPFLQIKQIRYRYTRARKRR